MPNYNPAKAVRLLQYNNASNEVLVDVTRYALDGDADKYIEIGYSTYLNLEPVTRIPDARGDYGSGRCQALLNKNSKFPTVEEWKTFIDLQSYLKKQFFHVFVKIHHIIEQSLKDGLSVRNINRTGDISTDLNIYYNWKHTEGLSSLMARTTTPRNRDDFLKTITLYRYYQTCTFNLYDMDNIFCLKPIIEYRLELMQSYSRCNACFSKNNVLLDTYEWEKFTKLEPHMTNQFFYDSSKIQRVLDKFSKDELSIRYICKTDDITYDVTISYHWEYSEGLSSTMVSMIAAAVSDPMRNRDNFIKTITLQRDYRTCTFNRYDVEAIFHLKPIINYPLEIMRSSGFKEFFDNIVECVIMQKSKREEIRRMHCANVDDFQVYDDGVVYEIFEQLLNSKYNMNSYNVLCVMEMY
ncbi:hypothetical protein FQA39_LY15444 [Lamprigera yunnana]|nr:hypothetical protein FQA39_LY15444 [Lamprigera yunnana]